MYAYAGTPRTSCDGAKPAAVQARTAARALADGIEEFLHPSSSGALGPGFEEAGEKKKERLSIQGDVFILEWEKRRTSPYVVIHQQHPIEDGGEPGHVLERTAIRTRKWHGLGCGGYLGRRGQNVPQMLQKEEKVCRVG